MSRQLPAAILAVVAMASSTSATADEMALWRNADGPHLRGASIYQRRVYPELDGPTYLGPGPVGPPYVAEDFAALRQLGANVVVISHPGPFTEDPPYRPDPGVAANLDRLVGLAAAADLFVVIAVRAGPGRSEFTFFHGDEGTWFDASYFNEAVWSDPAAQAAWAAMWRDLAGRYRAHPAVVGYDLMVEPNANHALFGLWDPHAFHAAAGGGLADWNRLYPLLVAAIREVDRETPILVSPMSYAAAAWLPWLDPPADDRVVVTVHQYEPFSFTHAAPDSASRYPGLTDLDWDGIADRFDRATLKQLLAPLAAPGGELAVTEFGAARWAAGAAEFLADAIATFEAYGLNHMIWLWPPRYGERFAEATDFDYRQGTDPAVTYPAMPNPLTDVLDRSWRRNTVRPSNWGQGP